MNRLILILLAAIVSVAVFSGAPKGKRSSSSVRKERVEAGKKVGETQRQIADNKRTIRRKLRDFEIVSGQVEDLNKQIGVLKGQIQAYEDSITTCNDSITVLNQDIERIKKSSAQSLREARTNRQRMGTIELIFSSESFSQAMRRISYIKQLDRGRAKKTQSLRAKIAELEQKRQRIARLRTRQGEALAALDAQQAGLEKSQTELGELIALLRKDNQTLDKELRAQQELVENLDSELERAIEEERKAEEERLEAERQAQMLAQQQQAAAEQERLAAEEAARQQAQEQGKKNDGQRDIAQQPPAQDKASGQSKKKTQPAKEQKKAEPAKEPKKTEPKAEPKKEAPKADDRSALTGTFASNKGNLLFPVVGNYNITGKFGRGRHSSLSKVEVDNTGIDIQAQAGASARAVFDGTVSSIFYLDGYHNIVMVRHGEYLTVYANIDKLSVKKGDKVRAGQDIGKLIVDPVDDNHTMLHFEVRKEKEKLNPLDWVRGS